MEINKPKEVRFIFLVFVLSRILCFLFVYLGHLSTDYLNKNPSTWEGIPNWWLNPWTTYDSLYYITIAQDGYIYNHLTTAFLPLYPLLIKLGGMSIGGQAAAGVLISNVAFFLALCLFYRLSRLDYDARTARTAIWLLAFFPVTAFFSAVYTESLFLLLALLAFYFARSERWKLAGLFGLGAALTRNSGILIGICLLVEYLHVNRLRGHRLRPLPLISTTLPICGFAAVQLYLWELRDSPFASISVQGSYFRAPGLPWEPVLGDLVGFFTFLDYDLVTFVNLLVITSCLGLAWRYCRTLRPSYLIFTLGLLLMNLCYYVRLPPYTTGTTRYLSVAFPYILLLALLAQKPIVRRHALAATGTGIYICLLFSYLFGRKYFLG